MCAFEKQQAAPARPDVGACLSMLLVIVLLFCPFGAAMAPGSGQDFARRQGARPHQRTSEIYANQGEAFQVSTAAGTDGIVRRIEVRASSDNHAEGDWAVFALANVSEEQLERVIVAPHFRLVNSKLFWPDLGSQRIISITPSEGFALDRAAVRRCRRVLASR